MEEVRHRLAGLHANARGARVLFTHDSRHVRMRREGKDARPPVLCLLSLEAPRPSLESDLVPTHAERLRDAPAGEVEKLDDGTGGLRQVPADGPKLLDLEEALARLTLAERREVRDS